MNRVGTMLLALLLALAAWPGTARSLGSATLLKDINQKTFSDTDWKSGGPTVAIGDSILFDFYDSNHGRELWISDGTAAGTRLLYDTLPGPYSGEPLNPIAAGSQVFFTVRSMLWVTDGTTAGTHQVLSGGAPVPATPRAALGSRVYYVGSDSNFRPQLWVSDGTDAGTTLLAQFDLPSGVSSITNMTVIGTRVFFAGYTTSSGMELWVSDGTEAGTQLVRDLNPTGDGLQPAQISTSLLAGIGTTAYFFGSDGSQSGLWSSDGTPGGTVFIQALQEPNELVAIGTRLAFRALDGAQPQPSTALWISDGSSGGTQPVQTFGLGTQTYPKNLWSINGRLFFAGTGARLSTVSIAGNGSASVLELGTATVEYSSYVGMGGSAFFPATASGDTELWMSDGTIPGTIRVRDINPAGSSSPWKLSSTSNRLFFFATGGLWRSDGSEAGTQLVSGFGPEPGGAQSLTDPGMVQFTPIGDQVFFTAT